MEDNPFFETKCVVKIIRTMEEMVKTISIASKCANRYDNVSTYVEAMANGFGPLVIGGSSTPPV